MKYLFLIFLSLPALAQSQKTQVLFFGGLGFRPEYSEMFAQQMQTAAPIGLNYVFDAIAYPSTGQYYADALKDGGTLIKKYVKQINDNPDRKYVLVGHSSGSAYAIEIAKQIKNPKQISVIDLDGFTPPADLQNKVSVFCWGAYSAANLTIESMNYKLMKTCKLFREYPSNVCKDPACLHFSLIDAKEDNSFYHEINFKTMTPNLEWLSP